MWEVIPDGGQPLSFSFLSFLLRSYSVMDKNNSACYPSISCMDGSYTRRAKQTKNKSGPKNLNLAFASRFTVGAGPIGTVLIFRTQKFRGAKNKKDKGQAKVYV